MQNIIDKLNSIRNYAGTPQTVGINDENIVAFAAKDPSLVAAVDAAIKAHDALKDDFSDALSLNEEALAAQLQKDYVNFYPASHINPYVALAAAGPWMITAHGAVLHDSGGYGMLGLGHAPAHVIETMAQPWVMANIMTPSFSQARLATRLQKEAGHTRDVCPYDRFLCINSGSESVTVAARITDINALQQTSPGGRHEGKEIAFLGLRGAFHGRTGRPAQVSHSTTPTYKKNLASFASRDNLYIVEINDCASLQAAFDQAEADGIFFEALFMEPVMGEGNPGMALERDFYDLARKLTKANNTLLLIDSIQAGLRTTGCLSFVDYPGFEDAECPDMESWSKALNAGQYPLSVLAMNEKASNLYVQGVYGNTMTTNPRALEVACTVLDSITPALRQNIRDRGTEIVAKLIALGDEFPGAITTVQGTGLLLAAELHPTKLPVTGFGNVEEWCRKHGIGVIHGGKNALRYTPHFNITSAEIDLIVDNLRQALTHFWK